MQGTHGSRHHAFALVQVDEERMSDGRRILYFLWPDEPDAGGIAVGGASAPDAGAPHAEGPTARPAPIESDPIGKDT
jgi:hypothetical protein